MEILLHIANILYLFSYSVKDIMALRLLTVVAASCLLPYFYFRAEPMYAAIAWNMLFNVINVYRIFALYAERRPVYFEERDQLLYDNVFSTLSRQQFARLLKVGEWKEAGSDEFLFNQGEVIDKFIVLCKGEVSIEKNNQIVDKRTTGDFLGESCLVSDLPIKANVKTSSQILFLCWSSESLKKSFDDDPVLHASFQRIISQVLIERMAV